jgi:PTH1 family peptidyl-tRNA hydrolase
MLCYLIAGLGNPGQEYRLTRHNVGFMVVDSLVLQKNRKWTMGPGPYEWIQIRLNHHDVMMIKPNTYMNRSGIAIADARLRLKIPFSQCLIVIDDLALPLGRLRIRAGGSDGGHRGLASVIRYLHSQEIPRLRLGIGNSRQQDTVSYVLSPFEKNNSEAVQFMIGRAVLAIEQFVLSGVHETMNTVNQFQ